MPAIRFFALLKEGRRQAYQEKSLEYLNLCDIASISLGDGAYFEKVRDLFYSRAMGLTTKKTRVLDPTDPSTVELIESLTMTASRVN